MAKRKFSPAQIAAQKRFAEMARARAKGAARAVARPGGHVAARSGGFVDLLLAGAIAALWATGGKVLTRLPATLLKIDGTTPTGFAMGAGVQLVTGAVLAYGAEMFLDRQAGALLFAGAVQGVAESGIRRLNVPMVAPLLGDEGDALMGYTYELRETVPREVSWAQGMGPLGLYPGGAAFSMYPNA